METFEPISVWEPQDWWDSLSDKEKAMFDSEPKSEADIEEIYTIYKIADLLFSTES